MNRMAPGRQVVAEGSVTITQLVQSLEVVTTPAEAGRAERRQELSAWMASEVEIDPAIEHLPSPALKEVALPSRPETARTARLLIDFALRQQWRMPGPITESAVLMVSELVTNVVRHTGARTLGLRVRRRAGWIRIEVRDPSRGLPCLMPPGEGMNGRGLRVVDQLSDRWGVDLLPRGKSTWVELRLTSPQARGKLHKLTGPD
ncbi:ATP-binding protein [Streptomyces sp. NPDC012474]|uniref:ATP-binding protein n=1 Tax=Streptomyces sp. NPDC012474 TaxID=3364836 RepID=UPI0036E18169